MLYASLILLIASQIVVGLLIFLQSRHAQRDGQRLFAAIALILALWTIANVILLKVGTQGSAADGYLPAVNRIAFTLGCIALVAIYLFSFIYPVKINANYGLRKVIAITGLFLTAIAPFDFVAGIFTVKSGAYVYHGGSLVILVALYALVVIVSMYVNAFRTIKHGANDSLSRHQAATLVAGMTFTIVHAVVFIVIMPAIFGQHTTLYAIGYLAPFYLIAGVAYGLLRLKLFDIRFFVVRATAYLSTLFIMTILLVAPLVWLLGSYFDFHPGPSEFALVVMSAVAVLYILQYLRKVFDKYTAKIFFRHDYDPQEVLDRLSNALVKTADIAVLRDETSAILKEALKPGSLGYVLFADGSEAGSVLARQIESSSPKDSGNIIYADEEVDANSRLGELFKSNDIALAAKLRTTHEDLGYLVVNHKQSGEIYNNRDKRLLSVAADEIAISMQNALRFEEIKNFNMTLQRKIEEATRQLRRSNKRLKVLDEAKDDFISMASHQLRTPLTSMKGYVSLVLDGDAGPVRPEQRKLLDQAFASSQRIVYLIADLLNVSRLRTGKFVIESSPVNLADMVQDEITQLQESAAGKNISLLYKKPAHFPVLQLDETKIRQVVMNFIDNALYYTPEGGKITVDLAETVKSVELRVTDTGIGVPKADQHHLFTKFYRAKNAQKARPDGTGLGLFMAQKVVVAQGGAIIFNSREGQGSTFGFTFPKQRT